MVTAAELFKTSPVYDANARSAAKVKVNQGGTYSTKTYSILQRLFVQALADPNSITTIAGQDIPNLKAGAIRDAGNIVAASPLLQTFIAGYNRSDFIYKFNNGSIIEFKSYANAQDAHSGKRDRLFLNEANGIGFDVWRQLYMRTEKEAFIDYNPSAEFWVHKEIIGKPWAELIISDHRHNPFISERKHQEIESDDDPEHFKVYGRGMTGHIEGLIFKINVVPGIPADAKYVGTGMDFGFTNDPTTLIDVYELSGELYLDERMYETGLNNVPVAGAVVQHANISDRLNEMGFNRSREITADSAEQKSINELSSAGWYVVGAAKGPGSVQLGIEILQRYQLNVTQRSTHLRNEAGHYMWDVNKAGERTNKPKDKHNHCWDAVRYVALKHLNGASQGDSYDVWL